MRDETSQAEMRILHAVLAAILFTSGASGAVKQIFPPGTKTAGPYSPGILTDDFLYVSGQGAKDAAGQIPADPEGQLRNVLENIKGIVEGAGLTMEHVVYTQVYLTDYSVTASLNRVFKDYFPKAPPARSTIGVAKLPGTPLEISAVAVRDLAQKKVVAPPGHPTNTPVSPGVIAGDRLYPVFSVSMSTPAGSRPTRGSRFNSRSIVWRKR